MKPTFMELTTVNSLINDGKEILFINANRQTPINGKNVKGKMESLKKCGMLNPLHLTPAKYATAAELELQDENGTPVTDPSRIENAYIILDGNNRYKAYLEVKRQKAQKEKKGKAYDAGKALEDVVCIINNEEPEGGLLNTLIEMNTTAVCWSGKDYARTAAQLQPDNEVIAKINELAEEKMPYSTISLYLAFNKNEITPAKVSQAIKTGRLDVDANLERANRILATLKDAGFAQKVINKRYFIEFIIKNADRLGEILEAIKELSKVEVETISNALADSASFDLILEKID